MILEQTPTPESQNNIRFSNGFIKLMAAHAYHGSLPRIIHINGENASGKSTLLREFIRYYAPKTTQRIFIADNEGGLSSSHLRKMFSADSQILDRIYHFNSQTIKELLQLIDSLPLTSSPGANKPVLIVNSFSRLLKSTIGGGENYTDYIHSLHTFSDRLFPKLSDLAAKGNFLILLVHHVSFSPNYDSTIPYFADFMNLLQGSWISLKTTPVSRDQISRQITFSNIIQEEVKGKTRLRHISESRQYNLSHGRFLIHPPESNYEQTR